MEHLKQAEKHPFYKTSDRKFEYITAKEGTGLVKVQVAWREGGMNLSTYKTEPKGVYLTIQPGIKREVELGMMTESYGGFTGYCFVLAEFPKETRYSLKTLTLWASILDKHIPAIAELAKDEATAKTKILEFLTKTLNDAKNPVVA